MRGLGVIARAVDGQLDSGAVMKRASGKRGARAAITWDTVRDIALAFPGAEECTSYGTPAFKVGGKLLVRFRPEIESVVVPIGLADREMRMRADPRAFYITDHYVPYPWMLVRLRAIRRDDLANLLNECWRMRAPKRLLAKYELREK